MANPIAVAALVVLAGRLPGHTEPDSNFWPPDAQADGVVDEHRELRLATRGQLSEISASTSASE